MSNVGGGGGHDFVRPFIMTGGRTRTDRRDLRVETMLQATVDAIPKGLPSEQEALLRVCREPLSVAEANRRPDWAAAIAAGDGLARL